MDCPDAVAPEAFAVVGAAVDWSGVVAPVNVVNCPDAPPEEDAVGLMAVPGRGAFVQRQVCLLSIKVKPCSLYMYGIV